MNNQEKFYASIALIKCASRGGQVSKIISMLGIKPEHVLDPVKTYFGSDFIRASGAKGFAAPRGTPFATMTADVLNKLRGQTKINPSNHGASLVKAKEYAAKTIAEFNAMSMHAKTLPEAHAMQQAGNQNANEYLNGILNAHKEFMASNPPAGKRVLR